MFKLNKLMIACALMGLTAATGNAAITLDFGVGSNIGGNVPTPLTVPIDIDAAGVATINSSYVTGAGVAPVVGISGSSTYTPAAPITINVVVTSSDSRFRVATNGGLGVPNNYIVTGEGLSVSYTSLPTDVAAVSISGEVIQSKGSSAGNMGGTAFSGIGTDTAVSLPADTGDFTLTAGDGDRFKFGALAFDIMVVPEPATMTLMAIGGIAIALIRRRRRA